MMKILLFVLLSLICSSLEAAEGLRDVYGPVALAGVLWPWAVLACLILAVVLFFLLRVKGRPRPAIVEPPRPCWETALQALFELERSKLLSDGRVEEYYFRLSRIVRQYIEERFDIHAPEMTTEEFMEAAKSSSKLTDAHKKYLREFLGTSDMVKFAKYIPDVGEMKDVLAVAVHFVNETRIAEAAG